MGARNTGPKNACLGRRAALFAGAVGLLASPLLVLAQADSPAATINTFDSAVLSIMKAGRQTPFKQRYEMLAPAVERTFDLETILRNSVGLSWSQLSPDQTASLLDTFRRYTIASWVANFDSYSGEQFQVSSDLRRVGADVVVPSYLVARDGTKTELSYVMRQAPSGWKVVDVLADGSISRVAVQRSDFRSLLTSGGVTALQASLQRKISSLSDGAIA